MNVYNINTYLYFTILNIDGAITIYKYINSERFSHINETAYLRIL